MRSYLDDVTFGNKRLQSVEGLMVTRIDNNSFPQRNLNSFSLANADGGTTSSAFFGSRNITISAVIARQSRELLDQSISNLREIVDKVNQTLRLPVESTHRDYRNVTLSSMSLQDSSGGYTSITLGFVASDVFGYDTISTELLNVVNLTSGNKSYPVTVEGTASQLPIITLTLDSATTTSNRSVTFTNPATGVSISVQRDWTASEVLVIDCDSGSVKVDDVDVEFSGNFLEFASGDGNFAYSDNFTERQVDINVTYTKRYR